MSDDTSEHCCAAMDALRARVEGRNRPPTPEEIEAHRRVGGLWLCRDRGGNVYVFQSVTLYAMGRHMVWCLALTRTGEPTTWPEAGRTEAGTQDVGGA